MDGVPRPLGRGSGSNVATTGVAIALTEVSDKGIPVCAVELTPTEAAYVGFGNDDTVPTAAADNTVTHTADVARTYWFGSDHDGRPSVTYLYLYSQSSTTDYTVNFFG